MRLALKDGTPRRVVALAVLSAFLFALALAAVPDWHAQIHLDQAAPNHLCAVTLVAAGNYEHAAAPRIVVAPQPVAHVAAAATLHSVSVAALFLSGAIFEHAPPAIS
jgi:hypothetical protein